MKCENCGGNLTLEDVVCPHCEAVNPHAIEHIREMKRYQKDYEGTKEQVYDVTKRYVSVSVRIIVIAVLIVLIILCGILSDEGYSIHHKMNLAKSERNYEEYTAVIEEYLEDGEYNALYSFLEAHYITNSYEIYEEYRPVIRAVTQYSFFYNDVIRVIYPYSEESLKTYPSRIEGDLASFYKLYDEEHYINVYDNPKHKEDILKMEKQMNAMLVAYCGLTMEEAEGLKNMTQAERMSLLEERLLNEE